jgi:flagellar protein FliJ
VPFEFRLETILRLRESEEGQLRDELALLNARATATGQEIARLGGVREQHMREVAERRTAESLDLEKNRDDGLYLDRLNADISNTKSLLEEQRAAADAKREELVSKRRERRILEKLKDKHRTRYLKELDRKEATLVDELSLTRYGRE